MADTTPLVSVIIPTYNRRDLVQLALDSVLAQAFTDFEIIVVDDGSTDDTNRALQRYGDRITYLWQENQGESAARNRGVRLARGSYVAFLDSDDLWMPDKLHKQLQTLGQNPSVGFAFCDAWLIDNNGVKLDIPPLGTGLEREQLSLQHLMIENSVTAGGSTVVCRKSLLSQVGGFDEGIRFGEDWDLWLRLRVCTEFAFVPEPLACIRRHATTQCHLPRPEHIQRKLHDHLCLLEKAFSNWQGGPEQLVVVRASSFARQYAAAAFANYAWHKPEQGRVNLEQAIKLDAPVWGNHEKVIAMMINYGSAVAELEAGFSVERMQDFVEGIYNNQPSTLNLSRRSMRRVLGALNAEAAYSCYLTRNRADVRHFTWQAIKADPALITNVGMIRRALADEN